MTIEEIREQMSLYQRLLYQEMKNSPKYQEARRQTKRKHDHLKQKKAEHEEGRRLEEGLTDEPVTEKVDTRKHKKDLNDVLVFF